MTRRQQMVRAVRAVLAEAPPNLAVHELFDSFEYTRTGRNLAHSRVLGWLVRAAWRLPLAAAVEVDVLNVQPAMARERGRIRVDVERRGDRYVAEVVHLLLSVEAEGHGPM